MKTVVITGSARGLGYNMARFFREYNYNVVLSDLNEEKLKIAKEELEKLNSTDGTIEMLCGIPNFKSEMYNQLDEKKQDLIDYTMSIDLISNWQIENNLRRSLDSENIALLEKRKLIALSLLYFGKKDEFGNSSAGFSQSNRNNT